MWRKDYNRRPAANCLEKEGVCSVGWSWKQKCKWMWWGLKWSSAGKVLGLHLSQDRPALEAKHSQLVLLQIKPLTSKAPAVMVVARTGSIQPVARSDKASMQCFCLSCLSCLFCLSGCPGASPCWGTAVPVLGGCLLPWVPIQSPRGGITHLAVTV